MPDTAPLLTAEQLEKFSRDDRRYELVRGRLVQMSPVGFEHGRTVASVLHLLTAHLRSRGIGLAVPEVGFILHRRPDTVRAPDVAFVARDRLPNRDERGFFKGPPDAALEVLSPDDRPPEIRAKIDDYLGSGVRLVVIIDPRTKTVILHRRAASPSTFSDDDDIIDMSDILEGFRCTVREIFD